MANPDCQRLFRRQRQPNDAVGSKQQREGLYAGSRPQVVPSFEDTSLNAVHEYRELMEKYHPTPPATALGNYQPQRYSFASFEGFLDAKLLVEIFKRMGNNPVRSSLLQTVEGIKNFDLGIHVPISFAPDKHQALEKIYYTTPRAEKTI